MNSFSLEQVTNMLDVNKCPQSDNEEHQLRFAVDLDPDHNLGHFRTSITVTVICSECGMPGYIDLKPEEISWGHRQVE